MEPFKFVAPVLAVACLAGACGGSSPSAPGTSTSTTPVTSTPTTPAATPCTSYRDQKITLTTRTASFTNAPFNASELALITNGDETNDPRFSYQWVKSGSTSIYAPADGVLIRIRHKAENLPDFPSDDYDFFFLAACDPARPSESDTIFRFNHITDPRADLKAAYGFGALPAPSFNPFDEHEERQAPTTNIVVRAGELLGSTRGTPFAHDFDFSISVNNATVCPFSVLNEPHKTTLLNMLGPISSSPFGPPTPGYPCRGYGAKP